MTTGLERLGSPGHSEDVVFVGFSADNRRVISAGDSSIRVWDLSGAEVAHFQEHKGAITSGAMTKDGQTLATASSDGTVRLWDLRELKLRGHLAVGRGYPLVAFSANAKTLAVKLNGQNENDIQLWDLENLKEIRRFGSGNSGEALVFLADGKLVDLSVEIAILDPETGREIRRFDRMPHHNPSTSLAISLDSRIAATGFADADSPGRVARQVTLWHIPTATPVVTFDGHAAAVVSLAYSPDGWLLATGSWDGGIRIWEALSGRELACFTGHRGGIRSLAFSRDGRLLATGGSDGSVLVWSMDSVPRRPKGPSGTVQETLVGLWHQLGMRDARAAQRATARLVAQADVAVVYLKQQLTRPRPSEAHVQKLISMLDDPSFSVRENAIRELADLCPDIEPILEKAVEGKASLEARRRIQKILESVSTPPGELDQKQLRELRLVHILECINTDASVELLERVAKARDSVFLRHEATASLQRIKTRRATVALKPR